jgi:hypothetical protein
MKRGWLMRRAIEKKLRRLASPGCHHCKGSGKEFWQERGETFVDVCQCIWSHS